jgi:multimeric flavodoxin WrbA
MKVVAFNGSPNKNGNTYILINKILLELESAGIGTELVQLSENKINGCIACYKCFNNKNRRCAVQKDAVNEYIEKIEKANGIILGSPVYFLDITPELKMLIDRAGFVSKANSNMFRNKIGSAVASVRRIGASHALDTISHFFVGSEIVMAGWCVGMGYKNGEVEKDEEGMRTAKTLGKRMAWLLEKLQG